jgi:hypothetical protein
LQLVIVFERQLHGVRDGKVRDWGNSRARPWLCHGYGWSRRRQQDDRRLPTKTRRGVHPILLFTADLIPRRWSRPGHPPWDGSAGVVRYAGAEWRVRDSTTTKAVPD